MKTAREEWIIWIDWEGEIVSFHAVPGYECVCFENPEHYRAKILILMQAGFRFQ